MTSLDAFINHSTDPARIRATPSETRRTNEPKQLARPPQDPPRAVFTDIEGGVWMIDSRNPATGACWMLSPETVRMSAKHVLRKWGPLTPVWRPDQAVGSPKVASNPNGRNPMILHLHPEPVPGCYRCDPDGLKGGHR